MLAEGRHHPSRIHDSDTGAAGCESDIGTEKLWHSVAIAMCVPSRIKFQDFVAADGDIISRELMDPGHGAW